MVTWHGGWQFCKSPDNGKCRRDGEAVPVLDPRDWEPGDDLGMPKGSQEGTSGPGSDKCMYKCIKRLQTRCKWFLLVGVGHWGKLRPERQADHRHGGAVNMLSLSGHCPQDKVEWVPLKVSQQEGDMQITLGMTSDMGRMTRATAGWQLNRREGKVCDLQRGSADGWPSGRWGLEVFLS